MQGFASTAVKTTPAMRRQIGVSLIEAMVALAIMGFGILGVVGVQATLRSNGDTARQRAEAVRIAQEAIEDWRGFTTLTLPLPAGHTTSYAQIATAAIASAPFSGTTNTSYDIAQTVSVTTTPPSRSLQVDVSWTDRSGTTQHVVLTSRIAGILPELSGALSIAPRAFSNAQFYGRNSAIPFNATDLGNGSSTFTPPGSPSGTSWTFSNTTGLITSCTPACGTYGATLLSGYITFSLGTPQTPPVISNIPLPVTMTQVQVNRNVVAPTIAASPDACFTSVYDAATLAYYCAVPLPAPPAATWSGWSNIIDTTQSAGALPISPAVTDVTATNYKVCRYTTGVTPPVNSDHPQNYSAVATSLTNQNFLVISAGDGSTAFSCGSFPGTAAHQPF